MELFSTESQGEGVEAVWGGALWGGGSRGPVKMLFRYWDNGATSTSPMLRPLEDVEPKLT